MKEAVSGDGVVHFRHLARPATKWQTTDDKIIKLSLNEGERFSSPRYQPVSATVAIRVVSREVSLVLQE